MAAERSEIEQAIKSRIVAIADALGSDARALARDELIPATGYIDSAGLLELIAWYEHHFGITVDTEDFTIDNLGTLEAMAEFVLRRKSAS
jgi:acyl carrier protein